MRTAFLHPVWPWIAEQGFLLAKLELVHDRKTAWDRLEVQTAKVHGMILERTQGVKASTGKAVLGSSEQSEE